MRRAALGLLNAVDLGAVQTSGGGWVEPSAGLHFGVYAGPIGINGSTRQGFEPEATIDVRCLPESLSNRLGGLLRYRVASIEDQVKTNFRPHTDAMLISLSQSSNLHVVAVDTRNSSPRDSRAERAILWQPRLVPSLGGGFVTVFVTPISRRTQCTSCSVF